MQSESNKAEMLRQIGQQGFILKGKVDIENGKSSLTFRKLAFGQLFWRKLKWIF